MVRELAHDEAAYRSLTLSWFRHSIMSQLLRQLAQTDYHKDYHHRPRLYPYQLTRQNHR